MFLPRIKKKKSIKKLVVNNTNSTNRFNHFYDKTERELSLSDLDFHVIMNIRFGDSCDITIREDDEEVVYSGNFVSISRDQNNRVSCTFQPCSIIGVNSYATESTSRPKKESVAICRKCREGNPWAEPDSPDGTFMCYSCRERIKYFCP